MYDMIKHVEVNWYFIRKRINSELELPYVKIPDQIAVIFIKGLIIGNFNRNMDKLDIFDIYVPT